MRLSLFIAGEGNAMESSVLLKCFCIAITVDLELLRPWFLLIGNFFD